MRKNLKKILSVVLIGVTAFSLSGCSFKMDLNPFNALKKDNSKGTHSLFKKENNSFDGVEVSYERPYSHKLNLKLPKNSVGKAKYKIIEDMPTDDEDLKDLYLPLADAYIKTDNVLLSFDFGSNIDAKSFTGYKKILEKEPKLKDYEPLEINGMDACRIRFCDIYKDDRNFERGWKYYIDGSNVRDNYLLEVNALYLDGYTLEDDKQLDEETINIINSITLEKWEG